VEYSAAADADWWPEEKELLEDVRRAEKRRKLSTDIVDVLNEWGRRTDFLRLYQARASARSGKWGKGCEAAAGGVWCSHEALGNHRKESSKAGWSWGCVSALDSAGRTIWITDEHRDDGTRFVVREDEKLTALLELESAIRAAGL
jgi:hypothetical protein